MKSNRNNKEGSEWEERLDSIVSCVHPIKKIEDKDSSSIFCNKENLRLCLQSRVRNNAKVLSVNSFPLFLLLRRAFASVSIEPNAIKWIKSIWPALMCTVSYRRSFFYREHPIGTLCYIKAKPFTIERQMLIKFIRSTINKTRRILYGAVSDKKCWLTD